MTIRRTLLLFFLLMGLTPATILTGLAFFQARNALKLEITRNLQNEASVLMSQIDRTIYQHVLDVHTWSHLEVMQEVRAGDPAKRLSQVLLDLNKHYEGVYKTLFCTNPQGQIVAASDPSMVGAQTQSRGAWLTASLAHGETRLTPLFLGKEKGDVDLEMESTIYDMDQREEIGQLHVLFDWTEIFRLLDQLGKSTDPDSPAPLAVLIDADGRIIAASSLLRKRGLLLSNALASWKTEGNKSAVIHDSIRRLGYGEVLAGSSTSQGYQGYPSFDWTVQIYQPTEQAFAPIHRMATAFFFLLCLTSAAAVTLSMLIADRIAQPFLELKNLTQGFMQNQQLVNVIKIGKGEVGELTLSFLRLILDLEKSRENLVRAAKLAVVGEMAAIMAHEVRTPLGVMRSSTQMLQREPALSETGREMLDYMLSETDRLNRLITSLLDCARPRPPQFKTHHLHDIAQRAMDLLSLHAQKKNIRIISELGAMNDLLRCDEEQILQVLLNLLMNAVQILPPEGEITLRTFGAKTGLILNVDDNGPGISADERTKVFDPFFTKREGGIGLGLTVVQQIIRAHGAEITAGPSPSGGARFHIFFPETKHPAQETH